MLTGLPTAPYALTPPRAAYLSSRSVQRVTPFHVTPQPVLSFVPHTAPLDYLSVTRIDSGESGVKL